MQLLSLAVFLKLINGQLNFLSKISIHIFYDEKN